MMLARLRVIHVLFPPRFYSTRRPASPLSFCEQDGNETNRSSNHHRSKIIAGVAVKRIHLILRRQRASLSDASLACLLAGRVLISLIAILLPTMLWTEHFTAWDKFFEGGQDCELSLLALFAFLCLVILLSHRGRQAAGLRMVLQRVFAFIARKRRGASGFSVNEFLFATFQIRLAVSAPKFLPLQLRI
jgi:hypothetical protein